MVNYNDAVKNGDTWGKKGIRVYSSTNISSLHLFVSTIMPYTISDNINLYRVEVHFFGYSEYRGGF